MSRPTHIHLKQIQHPSNSFFLGFTAKNGLCSLVTDPQEDLTVQAKMLRG
jgi:hypothetical protein